MLYSACMRVCITACLWLPYSGITWIKLVLITSPMLADACRLMMAATCPGMGEWQCASSGRSTLARGESPPSHIYTAQYDASVLKNFPISM